MHPITWLLGILVGAGAISLLRLRRAQKKSGSKNDGPPDRLATELAGLVHELRTPLAAIRAYAELLDGAGDDPAFLHEASAILVEEAERLDTLIARRLTAMRVGNDLLCEASLPPRQPRLLLGPEMRAACDLLVPLAMQSDLDLVAAPLASDWTVDAPAPELRQILTNLIGNAIKYCHPGKRIEVRARRALGETWVEVADDGPGFDEGDFDRLFLPFGAGKAQHPHQGHGLGLWIARELARSIGGELEAERGTEKGALLRLRLPDAGADRAPSSGRDRVRMPAPAGPDVEIPHART